MKKKILITGGTGRIATCIANGLNANGGYEVVRTTRGEGNGKDLIHVDYADQQSMIPVFTGVDTIIHLGFFMRNTDFLEKHIGENTVNAFHLYEAARIAGVKRVIFGSSNHVLGFYQRGDSITSDSLYRPDSPYALAKVFVEMIGRYYADRYGISCFNIRIGNFTINGNTQPLDTRAARIWLSNDDCVQLFTKLLEYDPDCKYLQMFGMSANEGCFYDTSDNAVIGYEPKDNGAAYIEELKQKPGRLRDGLDSKMLLKHNYVGGYNVLYDIYGNTDLDFLSQITKDYIDSDD